jgi:chaperonin GroES
MIKPLPGYALVEPIEDDLKSGDIYLPEQTKDKPSKGKVVEVSSWAYLPHPESIYFGEDDTETLTVVYGKIKKGTTVVYKKWTNQEVEHKGKKYLLVHFNELLAVIE